MFTVYSEKPNADTAYLYAGVVREAMKAKFEKLFGRQPVSREINDPLKVENTRVPDMILGSVDKEVAKILVASAIETNKNPSGEIPAPPSSTFLYSVRDDSSATVGLEAVEEYKEMEQTAQGTALSMLSGQKDVSVKDGVATISGETCLVDIGIFADNKEFASEFQYRLEQAGGEALDNDKKVAVFDELFKKLPGADVSLTPENKTALLKVVGLTSNTNI
jgi:hypothetical protein